MNPQSCVEAENPLATARTKSKYRWLLLVVAVVAPLVSLEIAGRYWGLHHPVVFERTTYGYRIVPGQDIRRFGNRAYFNSLGLRSEPASAVPAAGMVRILCLGDSVTYGGATTDQADTYPYQLQAQLGGVPGRIEVLNASAPGWAVDNELGWLRDNGTLSSRYVVLTLSTHDLFQPLAMSSTVGTHPSFPDHRPMLALEEIAVRYVLPRLLPSLDLADPGVRGDEQWTEEMARANRDSVLLMDQMVRNSGGTLVVMISTEAIDPNQSDLANSARRQLVEALDQRDVGVLNIDAAIQRYGRAALFRDTVHPNPEGNRVLAAAVAEYLRPRIAGDTRG
jgi:lysophospholipase L1-like esterase